MSAFSAQNNTHVFVAADVARTASVQYTDPNAANYLAVGEILVTGYDGAILTNTVAYSASPSDAGDVDDKIRLVMRDASGIKYSPWIDGRVLKRYTGTASAPATEQVYTLGYNGTSGSIDNSGTDPFKLTIAYTFDESMWSEQGNYEPYIYDEVASPTQEQIAAYMAEQINYKGQPNGIQPEAGEGPLVRAEILTDEAGTGLTAATGALTAVQGSKTISVATAIDAEMSVGDWIRISSTATTGGVYEIVSMDTTAETAELNMPFQGTTIIADTITNHEFVANAAMAASECGLRITAQPAKWTLDFFKYLQVTFRVGTKGFGTSTVTETDPVRPVGSYEQVAELESFSAGFEGALNRTIVPLPTRAARGLASDAETYNILYLRWEDQSDVSPISGVAPASQELFVCLPNDTNGDAQQSDATNGVRIVLNAWSATTPGAFGAVAAL